MIFKTVLNLFLRLGDAATSGLLLSKALALLPSNDQSNSTSLRLVLMTGLAKIKIMSMEYRAALQLYVHACILFIVDQRESNDKFFLFL